MSDAFFRNLTGPQYRIEIARRLQAAADIDLVRLARLAAAAEGRPGRSIEELIAAGLLPPEFGPLCDGSHTVVSGDEVYDSLRGRLGSFVPIADVPVAKASQAEVSEYRRFGEFYATRWGRMDPVVAGVARTPLGNNREHVVIDLSASPWARQHFDLLRQWLGPADQAKMAPVAGDMAALDLTLTGERIFGGIQDIVPPGGAGSASGTPGGTGTAGGMPGGGGLAGALNVFPLGRLRDILVCYVGTSGELGPLRFLNLGIPPASDPDGYARSPLPFGGWRRQYGGFTLFSFQREVLDTDCAAVASRNGCPTRAGAVAGGRSIERPDHAGGEQPGVWPDPRDLAGQPAAAARVDATASRAAGTVPRGGPAAPGREARLPVGWEV